MQTSHTSFGPEAVGERYRSSYSLIKFLSEVLASPLGVSDVRIVWSMGQIGALFSFAGLMILSN